MQERDGNVPLLHQKPQPRQGTHCKHQISSQILSVAPLLFFSKWLISLSISAPVQPSPPHICPAAIASLGPPGLLSPAFPMRPRNAYLNHGADSFLPSSNSLLLQGEARTHQSAFSILSPCHHPQTPGPSPEH